MERKEAEKIIKEIKYLIQPDKSKWKETFAQYKYLSRKKNDVVLTRWTPYNSFQLAAFYIRDEYNIIKHRIVLVKDGTIIYTHRVPSHVSNIKELGYISSNHIHFGYVEKNFTVPIYDKDLWNSILNAIQNEK